MTNKADPVFLCVQYATDPADAPDEDSFRLWAKTALRGRKRAAELTIRIVGEHEGARLNRQWRNAPGATNVLAFGFGNTAAGAGKLLGDVVICAPVVAREARDQHKDCRAHWAHLVIHGVLHLLGFEHSAPEDAERMEGLEIELLEQLNYDDPYR